MPETKNVLELMSEMLKEQENYQNNCAINQQNNSQNIEPDPEPVYVNENKVKPSTAKFNQSQSPINFCLCFFF